jgi:hypothetical protein
MKWSLKKALGLSDEELAIAEKRAQRIERDIVPDGALEYVPHTELYAARNYLGRKTLKKILGADGVE